MSKKAPTVKFNGASVELTEKLIMRAPQGSRIVYEINVGPRRVALRYTKVEPFEHGRWSAAFGERTNIEERGPRDVLRALRGVEGATLTYAP